MPSRALAERPDMVLATKSVTAAAAARVAHRHEFTDLGPPSLGDFAAPEGRFPRRHSLARPPVQGTHAFADRQA